MAFLTRTAAATVPFAESAVYETLIDYNLWPEWFPQVSSSRLLTREGDLAIVELSWGKADRESSIVECIHTSDKSGSNKSGLLRAIGGAAPAREIRWQTAPVGNGLTRVTLSVERSVGGALRSLRFPNPSTCLEALETALEAASPGPRPGSADETVFELWETEKGLVCWVRGRKYNLVAAEE